MSLSELPEKTETEQEPDKLPRRIASVLKAVSGKPDPKYFTSAVIVAAGSSRRMEGASKQMLNLCGMPVIVHTLRAFGNTPCIHEIIVVAKPSEIPVYDGLIKRYDLKKIAAVIPGGETRQDSVRLGLDAVNPKSSYIAISDGARCLVTVDMITRVCRNAYLHDAATAAMRTVDTVKIGDKNAYIDSTPDRKHVWLAQTPQVFKTNLYRAAAYSALQKNFSGTDDNCLVEEIGYPVKLVECGRENLKITTPADLYLAEAILRYRRDSASKKEPGDLSAPGSETAPEAEEAPETEEKETV